MYKKKIIKIIMIVVLILFILLILHTSRNFIIIKKLQKKAEYNLPITNYHVKETWTMQNATDIFNYYEKDGEYVLISEKYVNGEIESKLYAYNRDNGKKQDMFIEKANEKIANFNAYVHSEENIYKMNQLETQNDWKTLIGSITAKIKKINYNEKEYYVISNFKTSIYQKEGEKTIDKNTGLLVKMTNEDLIIEREYEFNKVTDEIFKEPDISNYDIVNGI